MFSSLELRTGSWRTYKFLGRLEQKCSWNVLDADLEVQQESVLLCRSGALASHGSF